MPSRQSSNTPSGLKKCKFFYRENSIITPGDGTAVFGLNYPFMMRSSAIMNLSTFPESNPGMYTARPLRISLLMLILAFVACNGHAKAPVSHTDGQRDLLNDGYAILHATLGDEQHLKTIRLTKTIVTFKSISEPTRNIIDDIAQTSSAALEEIEQLASLSPEILFDAGRDERIEQKTRRALRITTAKEFLTSKENFEVILLVSQTQALRFISHLARELSDIETNTRRKVWLDTLSDRYEALYRRVLSRLEVA
jgi:hypothetical protein